MKGNYAAAAVATIGTLMLSGCGNTGQYYVGLVFGNKNSVYGVPEGGPKDESKDLDRRVKESAFGLSRDWKDDFRPAPESVQRGIDNGPNYGNSQPYDKSSRQYTHETNRPNTNTTRQSSSYDAWLIKKRRKN